MVMVTALSAFTRPTKSRSDLVPEGLCCSTLHTGRQWGAWRDPFYVRSRVTLQYGEPDGCSVRVWNSSQGVRNLCVNPRRIRRFRLLVLSVAHKPFVLVSRYFHPTDEAQRLVALPNNGQLDLALNKELLLRGAQRLTVMLGFDDFPLDCLGRSPHEVPRKLVVRFAALRAEESHHGGCGYFRLRWA